MVLNAIFERFVESCPACVMFRAIMENIFAPAKLDALFHRSAHKQYERELLFSTLVDLLSQVVTRSSKSVHAAYVEARARICVSVPRSTTSSITSSHARRTLGTTYGPAGKRADRLHERPLQAASQGIPRAHP